MEINVTWPQLKAHLDSKGLAVQYFDNGDRYTVVLADKAIVLRCNIHKKKNADDAAEFEAGYKADANKQIDGPQQLLPFASKYIDGKSLYTRVHGVSGSVSVGLNSVDFVVPYTQAKFSGLEIVNAEAGDKVDLKVLDSASGMLTGVPYYQLNQFGYGIFLPQGFYVRESQYDADVYGGMVIRIEYEAIVAKTIKLNVILHELK